MPGRISIERACGCGCGETATYDVCAAPRAVATSIRCGLGVVEPERDEECDSGPDRVQAAAEAARTLIAATALLDRIAGNGLDLGSRIDVAERYALIADRWIELSAQSDHVIQLNP